MSQTLADGRQSGRLERYSSHWKEDTSKETQEDTQSRSDQYTDVVNGMYWQRVCFSLLIEVIILL
jgi:hypothetical protein